MKNLKQLLTQDFQSSVSKGFLIFLFVVAAIGFIDATYLTVEHFNNRIPPCVVGSCETVLSSRYSEVAGIPVALAGAIYYLLVLILLKVYIDTKKEKILRSALLFTTVGFLVSLYFVFLQAFVIHAFCQYCMLSALTSTLLFIASIYAFKKHR